VADSTAADRLPAGPGRFRLVDALRGFAATLVALFHFNGILSLDGAAPFVLQPLEWLFSHGNAGVQVFFVLSGFVVTWNVDQLGRLGGRVLGRFCLRRSLRLDPPYFLVIGLTLLTFPLVGRGIVSTVGPVDLVANLLYADQLFARTSVLGVGWTLCLEIQLYLVLFLTLWASQSLQRAGFTRQQSRIFVFLPLLASSTVLGTGKLASLFIEHWFEFFLGVTVTWLVTEADGAAVRWWLAALAATATVAWREGSVVPLFSAGTALLLGLASSRGGLAIAIGGAPLQWLGRISYSIYLLHVLVGVSFLDLAGRRISFAGASSLTLWALLLAALALSLGAAWAFWKLVEAPSQKLARRLFATAVPVRIPTPLAQEAVHA